MGTVTRIDSDFESAGTRCAAWLYLPDDEAAPRGCVVMAHGFSATREDGLAPYAQSFAEAGLAVLVFDYRCFGASDGEPRQQLDIGMQLDDWRAAVRHARGLPDVDGSRVGLWGSSFSGGHVITIAAEDHAVAAVVAQAPYVDGLATVRIMQPSVVLRAGVVAVRDQVAKLRGHQRVLLPAAGRPGETAALTAPEVVPGFAMIVGEKSQWHNGVTAAVFLRIPGYSPLRRVSRVAAPLLLGICDRDATVPPAAAERAAARARRAEVIHYDCGHFEIYVGDLNARARADQTAFLLRHLV